MHSLLRISESDSNILTYHRSLHDFFQNKKRSGEYHIHPLRIALVRLPKRIDHSETSGIEFLEFLMSVALVFLLSARLSLVPLFVISGIFFANRRDERGGTSVYRFIIFIFCYPFDPDTGELII